MKFLFVDEFKSIKKTNKFYGLVVVLIDNSSYSRFKRGFYERLKKIGWDTEIEIKGCFSFSSTKGDKKILIEDRLKFVEELFDLSKSSGNKYASAKVYYTLDVFPRSASEMDMYSDLLYRILKKIPNGLKNGNKNGKNNLVIFLDSNTALNIEAISEQSEKILSGKKLFLVERCIDFCSGNKTLSFKKEQKSIGLLKALKMMTYIK